MMEKEIELEIKKPELFLLVGFLAVVLFLELQVTLNSPIAFGDEAYHTEMSKYIAEKMEYPVWTEFESTNIHKLNYARPPLWNILEGSFYFIFGFSDVIVKFLVPFMVLMTGIASYSLVKKFYSARVALVASVLLVTVPSFVTYSVLFYVDISEIFWLALAIGTTVIAIKSESKKYWMLSAVFSALTVLTKTSGLFLLVFYFFYFIYEIIAKKSLLHALKKYWIVAAIVLLLIGPWALRNAYYYGNPTCSDILLLSTKGCTIEPNYTPQNEFIGRLAETGTESSAVKIGIMNYMNFAYGNVWLVPLTFFCGFVFLLKNRTKENLVLLAFLLISFIIIFRMLETRAEDLARYGLVSLPMIAVISAMYLDQIFEILKKYHIGLVYIVLIVVLVASFFNLNSKLSAARTFDESSQSYVGYKMFSSNFFDACDWVKKNTPKNSLLLSLNTHPTIYNCQRSAVWELQDLPDIILSNNVTLVLERLKLNGINYIFVQKFSLSNQAYRVSYPLTFIQFLYQNSDHFENVYENGPDMQTCINSGGCDGTIVYQVKW